jgi:regulatory protein
VTGRTTALEVAAAALAHRDRSAAGLAAYLEQHGIDPAEAAKAVERLESAGYVDDERFALARAEALASRGYGDEAIHAELARCGLATDRIAAAVDALEAEVDRARELVERDGPSPRTARRLAAKGFSQESLDSVFATIRHD